MCILSEIFRALMFDIWLQVTESRVKDDEYIKMQEYVLINLENILFGQTSKHSLNLKLAKWFGTDSDKRSVEIRQLHI